MAASRNTRSHPSGIIGTGEDLDPVIVLKGIRESLGVKKWRWRDLSKLRDAITKQQLIHHPLWLGKVVTYADRPPFPPKKTPNVVFVDAVSGYRGVLERVPTVTEGIGGDNEMQVSPVIVASAHAEQFVQAVLHTLNRGYVLKKPKHELAALDMVLLPLWKVTLDLDKPHTAYLNAVTGEPESYLARLWGSDSWLSLDDDALAPLLNSTASHGSGD